MITTSAPVNHGDFHTLDLEAPEWWSRLVCFQVSEVCGAFILQHHKTPVKGIYKGVYDHKKELVLGILSGNTTVDLGAQIASTTETEKPQHEVNVAVRKAMRMLQEGSLDELLRDTCKQRSLEAVSAGTDSKEYANLIRSRLNQAGFTEHERFSETGTRQYVWTREMLWQ